MNKRNSTKLAKQYALKRTQAQRNAVSRVRKDIDRLAAKAVRDGGISQKEGLGFIEAAILAGYEYAEAAGKYLYDEDNGITEYMDAVHFGKTFQERVNEQSGNLIADIGKILLAADVLSMSPRVVETECFRPYAVGGVIYRANLRGAGIEIPSYGRGIPVCGADQLLRNIDNTVGLAWGFEDYDCALRSGAKGFYVYRGSSYPCDTCQQECGVFHPMEDAAFSHPPFHGNCVCYAVYVY
jgi:hypothetical protein